MCSNRIHATGVGHFIIKSKLRVVWGEPLTIEGAAQFFEQTTKKESRLSPARQMKCFSLHLSLSLSFSRTPHEIVFAFFRPSNIYI